ncbi:methyltransferase [Variovorax sp. J22R133]|uniref:methyltransferase n=1 Tax=Variovorax brevis TaxID=3053503 RepID=UPI0025787F99|nr:methyltransferase [Variovorax sp. J22R133]MDM0117641.1 methyltransferase [Variovorax sp. J22R133]
MPVDAPSLARIREVATGYRPSKTLLSAVELGVFTALGEKPMTGSQLLDALGLHPRANPDFFDALVALRFLDRDGSGPDAHYRNTPDSAEFLDRQRPQYIGRLLEMVNERLYPSWGGLTAALRTGLPQNQTAAGSFFESTYADAQRCEQFVDAMADLSGASCRALAERFDWARYRHLCDVGGASGLLSMTVAGRHPHLHCTSLDLPQVTRIAERRIATAGLAERIHAKPIDFFAEPLPSADVVTMGMILHDWNLEKKMHLLRAAHAALAPGGALIVIEILIDDARREHVHGLMASLNMLIEFGDAFNFTSADLVGWCDEVGFCRTEVIALAGVVSAGIAYR